MTHQPDTPTLLLLEDDAAIATTLVFSLKKEGWDCHWAHTIGKADELASATRYHAMLLDIGLPDGTGTEFCQRVRFGASINAHVPIIFLTAQNDEIQKILGLEVGADDYITKPFSPKEVIARIKAIWRREQLTQIRLQTQHAQSAQHSPTNTNQIATFDITMTHGHWRYNAAQFCLSLNSTALPLTHSELRIMLTLLKNPNRILSRDQLLCAMSAHPEHRTMRTIDAHIKTLRQKLACITDTPIIVTHRSIGYSITS